MHANTPIDAQIRLAIVHWPDDAPRGAVTTFCAEYGLTRKSFYKIRQQALEDGPTKALEPRSRRPRTSPMKVGDDVIDQALRVRASLEQSGLDFGPISVSDKMQALGLTAPSPATLARAFRRTGVAREEPKKKPRSAWRRFVYPLPNDCWQIDATEYVLTRGRKCVVFQVEDDHSRLAISTLAAESETAEAAVRVVSTGIERHGVPRRLLSDNGLALNPSRRGWNGQLVTYVTSLGVEAITGKPYKPTTQGKNERFHQTLFRWLDKQPLCDTLEELQVQLDEFDHIYNTERPHQGLPGRVTPAQAYTATPRAEPPRPVIIDAVVLPGKSVTARSATSSGRPSRASDAGEMTRLVSAIGLVSVKGLNYGLGKQLAGLTVWVVREDESIAFYATNGDHLITYPNPAKGTKYLGKGHALEISPELMRVSPKC